MEIVHVANTDFEFELAHSGEWSIEQSWMGYPLCLQLQFLPLLYALPQEKIAVTSYPDMDFMADFKKLSWRQGTDFPTLALLKAESPFWQACCRSWGPSQSVLSWASKRKMSYTIPSWDIVRKINSKAFSFHYSSLKEASLLFCEKELQSWLKKVSGPKVLKTCFGLSGKGNRLVTEHVSLASLVNFCKKEWDLGRPLIGEPWLERFFDFSSQWFIQADGRSLLLGTAVFETDAHGSYLGTLAGPQEKIFHIHLPFLEQHLVFVRAMFQDLIKMGFFGHIGVDAFLYRCQKSKEICLYPIVEINARQTMSLAALCLQQRYFADRVIRLSFVSAHDSRPSLLPTRLSLPGGKLQVFKRKLVVEEVEF